MASSLNTITQSIIQLHYSASSLRGVTTPCHSLSAMVPFITIIFNHHSTSSLSETTQRCHSKALLNMNIWWQPSKASLNIITQWCHSIVSFNSIFIKCHHSVTSLNSDFNSITQWYNSRRQHNGITQHHHLTSLLNDKTQGLYSMSVSPAS